MGPCQGRLCGPTVTEMIARGARRVPGGGRLLPPAPARQADHAGGARLAAANARTRSTPSCITEDASPCPDTTSSSSAAASTAARPPCTCRSGASVVLVVEKDHVGRHASGVNAGGVRQLGRARGGDPAVGGVHGAVAPHRRAGGRRLRVRVPRADQGGRDRGRTGGRACPRRRTPRPGLQPRGGGDRRNSAGWSRR